MRSVIRYWRHESGSGAAEFTMVLIPFAALIFGIIHMSLLFYANQSLQFAAEAAARCFSVDANNGQNACGSAGHECFARCVCFVKCEWPFINFYTVFLRQCQHNMTRHPA